MHIPVYYKYFLYSQISLCNRKTINEYSQWNNIFPLAGAMILVQQILVFFKEDGRDSKRVLLRREEYSVVQKEISSDGNIVEKTESHCLIWFCMMTRWPDYGNPGVDLPSCDLFSELDE